MTYTRPDISYATKELARSLTEPTTADQQKLKHLLRYIMQRNAALQVVHPTDGQNIRHHSRFRVKFTHDPLCQTCQDCPPLHMTTATPKPTYCHAQTYLPPRLNLPTATPTPIYCHAYTYLLPRLNLPTTTPEPSYCHS